MALLSNFKFGILLDNKDFEQLQVPIIKVKKLLKGCQGIIMVYDLTNKESF